MEALGFVFDLDDTLYAERDYVRSCFRWIGARLGDGGASDDLWRLFDAGERDPVGVIALRHGLGDMAKSKLIEEMRAHAPSIALDRGAQAALARLREQGRAFSIVTNGRSVTQRCKIAALGLEDAKAIVISEEFGVAKPDAALFRAVEARHLAHRHLYVGDNPAIDFEAPNALGWMTAMIRREGGVRRAPFEPAPAQRAQRAVDSLESLIPLI